MPFGRPFQVLHPAVDKSGTLSWPSLEGIKRLPVPDEWKPAATPDSSPSLASCSRCTLSWLSHV